MTSALRENVNQYGQQVRYGKPRRMGVENSSGELPVRLENGCIFSLKYRYLLYVFRCGMVEAALHSNLESVGTLVNIFRRQHGSETWHFCSNCSAWPTVDYDERRERPLDTEPCQECQDKWTAGHCQ